MDVPTQDLSKDLSGFGHAYGSTSSSAQMLPEFSLIEKTSRLLETDNERTFMSSAIMSSGFSNEVT
jgi:hypothetical protein